MYSWAVFGTGKLETFPIPLAGAPATRTLSKATLSKAFRVPAVPIMNSQFLRALTAVNFPVGVSLLKTRAA
jgi:hypothetical protein